MVNIQVFSDVYFSFHKGAQEINEFDLKRVYSYPERGCLTI